MAKRVNVLKLSRSLTVPNWMQDLPGTGAPLDVAGRLLRSVLSVDDAAEKSIIAAGSNADLSQQGNAKARKADGKIQLELLAKIKAEAVTVVSAAVAKARKVKPDHDPAAVLISELRDREIRDLLLQKVGDDSLQLTMEIREAQGRGDSIMLDALLAAPDVSPLASMFDRADVQARRDQMVDASLGEETVMLIQAETDLFDRIEWAQKHIEETAGLNANDDNIAKIASGEAADE